ncbi:tRNA-uridine aminocarboxypropyltransferase [Cellvibrio polysaccharolyticus]|uniref:tRNA-uridine aminocarboxypropyltransferase n=1 Tax=Cellvibrio polysaccharolyticus TaxID=2082724 RepID=A0A928YW27_9GAMM|nr:tRNA-uridine aminocarboxypropyltransferase [Cellvibrio polysaccharolyticus]MBE8717748.1 DTW domain-containing protein [Cellvibrio polysaccharolyticus]
MSATPKRSLCPRCDRPQVTCLCSLATPIANRVEVIILRHPQETGNAKNTATLLKLSLARIRVLEGETFAAADLKNLLDDPIYTEVLLYPDTPESAALGIASPPPLQQSAIQRPEAIRLWVLDATWRKSRKMLYLNPDLQRLPRLSLTDTPASRYVIRKSHLPEQLSTLESTCYALHQLEQGQVNYTPLLKAFDQFISRQLTFLPAERCNNH